jgi:predicted helicase
MAPYAVAHLKLGMQLAGQDLPEGLQDGWSYDFGSDERLSLYLTNTLDDPEQEIKRYPGPLRVVSEEAEAAAEVKNAVPLLVVTGNPPYANFGQMNDADWISEDLMRDWKPPGEKKWNPDDFMKFMRWSEWKLNQSGQGVLAFITSRTYLDGITHRTMREHLRDTFDVIHLLDLHGDIYETPPDGGTDENVFDITKGVAIGLFVKTPEPAVEPQIHYHELWGGRDDKYAFLDTHDVSDTDWQPLDQVDRETGLGNFYFFTPKGFSFVDEYCRHSWSLDELFEVSGSGVQTDRNALFKAHDRETLANRMETFFSPEGVEPPFADEFRVENSTSYDLLGRRERTDFDPENIYRIADSPLNEQWIYYDKDLTSRPAWSVMRNLMREENRAIVAPRQSARGDHEHFFLADKLVDRNYLDTAGKYGNGYVFPLYRYPSDEHRATNGENMFNDAPNGRRPNLSPDFVDACKRCWDLDFVRDGTGDLETTFGPEDVLHYAYAIFHSPTYRRRYKELLRIDFPRLPLTTDRDLLRALCAEGAVLADLHLMNVSIEAAERPSFPVSGSNEIVSRHPRYVPPGEEDEEGRVYINEEQYVEGVEPAVWHFHVGGYQVCEKWLKDRKGRALDSFDALRHYQEIVATLRRTQERMDALDAIIDDHGGWPLAGAVPEGGGSG